MPDQPAKAAQKDTQARWTLKFAKGRPLSGGKPGIDIAIPSFGYKSSIAICQRYGFIRCGKVTAVPALTDACCATWSPPTTPPRRLGGAAQGSNGAKRRWKAAEGDTA